MVSVWRITDDSPNSPNFPAIQYNDNDSYRSNRIHLLSVLVPEVKIDLSAVHYHRAQFRYLYN